MDVDLSTNLTSFLPLVAPLLSGHSEVAVGTRLAHQSHVRRRWKREVLSRGYNLLVRLGFRAGFSDAQYGFKALRTNTARRLLPLVEDEGWFFDTELLLLAERNGMRIHEVPVDWIEGLDSRVQTACSRPPRSPPQRRPQPPSRSAPSTATCSTAAGRSRPGAAAAPVRPTCASRQPVA
jgi:hypothetical protein